VHSKHEQTQVLSLDSHEQQLVLFSEHNGVVSMTTLFCMGLDQWIILIFIETC